MNETNPAEMLAGLLIGLLLGAACLLLAALPTMGH